MTTTLEELWSSSQRTKQAVRQNHTNNHTQAVKWLCNGTNGNIVVVQILSLRPYRTKENHQGGSPLFVFYPGKAVFGVIVPRV